MGLGRHGAVFGLALAILTGCCSGRPESGPAADRANPDSAAAPEAHNPTPGDGAVQLPLSARADYQGQVGDWAVYSVGGGDWTYRVTESTESRFVYVLETPEGRVEQRYAFAGAASSASVEEDPDVVVEDLAETYALGEQVLAVRALVVKDKATGDVLSRTLTCPEVPVNGLVLSQAGGEEQMRLLRFGRGP